MTEQPPPIHDHVEPQTPAPFPPGTITLQAADIINQRLNQPEPRLKTRERVDLLEEDVSTLERDVAALLHQLNHQRSLIDSRANTVDLGAVRRQLTAIEAWQAGIDEFVTETEGRMPVQWESIGHANTKINELGDRVQKLESSSPLAWRVAATEASAAAAHARLAELDQNVLDNYVLAADHDLLHARVNERVDELERLTLRQSQAIVDLENSRDELLAAFAEPMLAVPEPELLTEIETVPTEMPTEQEYVDAMEEVQIDVGYTPAAHALQRYDEALRLIAGEHCTSFTGASSCINVGNRSAFGRYGADQWCDACIAWAALHNEPLR